MSETVAEVGEAKVFMHGRSQAVRLPKAFRVEGDRMRVRRLPGGKLLLEPVKFDVAAWFARIDAVSDEPFLEEGLEPQPPMPPDKISFD